MQALVDFFFQMSYNYQNTSRSNQFQPSFAFHIEPSHLICIANQMNGVFMERNAGLKWV